jgi:hypothetical protein
MINNTDNKIKEVLMSSVNDLEETKGTSRYTKALKSFIQ